MIRLILALATILFSFGVSAQEYVREPLTSEMGSLRFKAYQEFLKQNATTDLLVESYSTTSGLEASVAKKLIQTFCWGDCNNLETHEVIGLGDTYFYSQLKELLIDSNIEIEKSDFLKRLNFVINSDRNKSESLRMIEYMYTNGMDHTEQGIIILRSSGHITRIGLLFAQ